MKRALAVLFVVALFAVMAQAQVEPDYSGWTAVLQKYYDPAHGMDYTALKAHDMATVENMRNAWGKVNVDALNKKQQLAYWINVYNINTVATIVENYPTKSIRDLSTDPIIRLNVFKKERIPFGSGKLALNDVENEKIREGFHDPRIHFAINCAARSCPPLRSEAYTGEKLDAQLDDQARRFLNGPIGARFGRKGDSLVIHVTKIMDWFGKDFDQWGPGRAGCIRRYGTPDKQKLIDEANGKIDLQYDDYNWDLNDWKR